MVLRNGERAQADSEESYPDKNANVDGDLLEALALYQKRPKRRN
jgi:hypothetical protein